MSQQGILFLGVVQRSHLLQMRAAGKLGDNVNSTQAIKLPKAYIQAAKLLIDSVSLVTAFLLHMSSALMDCLLSSF